MTATTDKPVNELAKMDVLGRLDEIEAKLIQQDPMLGIHLATIHKQLLTYEELVHILPDEKIRVYMAGMQKYKQLQLVTEATKSRGKKGGNSVDDF